MSPTTKRPLVDQQSYALAEHFLQDYAYTEDDAWDLARIVQMAVEDWFSGADLKSK